MTTPDMPTCEKCRGKGRIVFTGRRASNWIEVNCRDCYGRGYIAPPPEPIKPDPDHRPAVGDHPAVAALDLCGQCLGTGEVIGFGADLYTEQPRTILRAPCPRCRNP